MITWDKRPTNDPQTMVLELDEGNTAEVDPQSTRTSPTPALPRATGSS